MSGTGQDGRPGAVEPGIGGQVEHLKGAFGRLRERFRRLPRARRIALPVLAIGLLLAIGAFADFSDKVSALRDRHAIGPAWAFPSIVYADGVPLVVGKPLAPARLRRHLEARGYRESASVDATPGTFAWRGDEVAIALRGFSDVADPEGIDQPELVRVKIERGRIVSVVRARTADTSKTPRLEPWPIASLAEPQDVRRTWVPLARIPKVLRDAVVASEDRRFRSHMGLDLRSNARALFVNVRERGVREGGSTITQQLARGLFLGRERSFGRKIREIFLALGLEILLSKDQILEMYLNSVYWGQAEGKGIAGIGEAARWYCSSPPESLGLGQSAMLAGIIPAPNAYSPFIDRQAAVKRRNATLSDMVSAGVLDAKTAALARARPLAARRGTMRADRYPAFQSAIRQYLDERMPQGASTRWGLSILSTCDLVAQADAERGLALAIERLDPTPSRGRRAGTEPMQAAFVLLDPATAEVRALVGGRRPEPGGFNRATQARRQPGSAIKPIVYAAAIDPERGGTKLTAASVVPDLPRTFAVEDTTWRPDNSDGSYHAQITLGKALARSENVATTNLVEEIGPATVARYAQAFGLGKLKPVLSIGLGANEVTLLDLTNAYAVFADGGVRREPRPVRAVVDASGKDVLEPPAKPVRVLEESVSRVMIGMLQNVVIYGIAYPLRKTYGFLRPVGGKTGTTNGYKDAWFMGFTPDLVAGVWVGYDTPRSLNRIAADVALPVWAQVVAPLVEGTPPTPFPEDDDLEWVWMDGWTGGRARSDCPSTMNMPFLRGTAPKETCRSDHTEDWARIFLERLGQDSLRVMLGVPGDSTLGPLPPAAPAAPSSP